MSETARKTSRCRPLKASTAFAIAAVLAVAAAVCAEASRRGAEFVQPAVPPGWKQIGQVRIISGDQIFDYMNGAGEIPKACRY